MWHTLWYYTKYTKILNAHQDRILDVQGITHVPVDDVKDERGMHFLKAVSLF